MNSKITIEIDFENGNQPVIQILHRESDDVRDRLIKAFLEKLAHTSQWCKINFTNPMSDGSRWIIKPIHPRDFEEEGGDMLRIIAEMKEDYEAKD